MFESSLIKFKFSQDTFVPQTLRVYVTQNSTTLFGGKTTTAHCPPTPVLHTHRPHNTHTKLSFNFSQDRMAAWP